MTDKERIEQDLRNLLDVIERDTPLLIQASGGPTLTIHDTAVSLRIVTILMEHAQEDRK